ncbi:MAG: sulfurtransferase [Isosphaeraceae bacterium]
MNGLPIFLVTVALLAQGPAPEKSAARLVGFDELQHRLADPNLRLLDARPRDDYDMGHIQGAVWVDVKAAEKLAARPGGLADRAAWEAWLEPLGIGPDSHVLIYDAKRQLDAARVRWLLSYLGVDHVGLVNGGFPLWEKEQRPVTYEPAKVQPRRYAVHFQKGRLAGRGDVLAALRQGKSQIIDARTEAEHTGAVKRSKRGGRIPRACPAEWTKFVDADGRFLDELALKAILSKAGVKSGEPVITHCQSGGRASVDAFVFEHLGFPTRNYYLGWSDWGNADDTPVESGPAAKSTPR